VPLISSGHFSYISLLLISSAMSVLSRILFSCFPLYLGISMYERSLGLYWSVCRHHPEKRSTRILGCTCLASWVDPSPPAFYIPESKCWGSMKSANCWGHFNMLFLLLWVLFLYYYNFSEDSVILSSFFWDRVSHYVVQTSLTLATFLFQSPETPSLSFPF
jgi:hypothetical protein